MVYSSSVSGGVTVLSMSSMGVIISKSGFGMDECFFDLNYLTWKCFRVKDLPLSRELTCSSQSTTLVLAVWSATKASLFSFLSGPTSSDVDSSRTFTSTETVSYWERL